MRIEEPSKYDWHWSDPVRQRAVKSPNPYTRRGSSNFTVWTCRDGTKVNLCDMSVQHLINTREMVRRKLNNVTDGYEREIWQYWLMVFKVEVNKNKDNPTLPL